MKRAALVAFLGLVASAMGLVAFSPADPLPADKRPLAGLILGLVALALGAPPWRNQRHPEWVRNLGLFGWTTGLALVVAGMLLFFVEFLRD